jgi:para-nitrobenzyl esterase
MHPVIETTAGPVRGTADRTVQTHLGIPYATARRFRPPDPAPRWTSIRDATRAGPAAPQSPSRLTAALGSMGIGAQDEDCLTVNIWAPDGATGRPVLVWLHGGAFTTGAGSQPWYDGARLARELGVVVVVPNYRLGALGFLHMPDAPGWAPNCGLLDQLAALEWTRANVAAFGGDPDRVTVAGQSAGAQSILALLHTPAAGRLFRRAVLQSAPLGLAPLGPVEAGGRARSLLAELGLGPAEHDRLLDVPTGALLAAQDAVARGLARPFQLGPAFQLVAGGGVPAELREPDVTGIEVVLTTTEHEADAFTWPDPRVRAMGPDEASDALRPLLGDTAAEQHHEHAAQHLELTAGQVASDLTTRHFFHRDLEPLAAHLRARGCAVRTARFSWFPAGSPLRACHCIDLPFTFGNLDAWRDAPLLRGAGADELAEQTRTTRAQLLLDHDHHGGDTP